MKLTSSRGNDVVKKRRGSEGVMLVGGRKSEEVKWAFRAHVSQAEILWLWLLASGELKPREEGDGRVSCFFPSLVCCKLVPVCEDRAGHLTWGGIGAVICFFLCCHIVYCLIWIQSGIRAGIYCVVCLLLCEGTLKLKQGFGFSCVLLLFGGTLESERGFIVSLFYCLMKSAGNENSDLLFACLLLREAIWEFEEWFLACMFSVMLTQRGIWRVTPFFMFSFVWIWITAQAISFLIICKLQSRRLSTPLSFSPPKIPALTSLFTFSITYRRLGIYLGASSSSHTPASHNSFESSNVRGEASLHIHHSTPSFRALESEQVVLVHPPQFPFPLNIHRPKIRHLGNSTCGLVA